MAWINLRKIGTCTARQPVSLEPFDSYDKLPGTAPRFVDSQDPKLSGRRIVQGGLGEADTVCRAAERRDSEGNGGGSFSEGSLPQATGLRCDKL